MKITGIGALLRAQPFRVFEIHLADGRHFTIHHPDYFILPPGDDGNISFVYDLNHVPSMIDLDLVTSVDVLPPVPAG